MNLKLEIPFATSGLFAQSDFRLQTLDTEIILSYYTELNQIDDRFASLQR